MKNKGSHKHWATCFYFRWFACLLMLIALNIHEHRESWKKIIEREKWKWGTKYEARAFAFILVTKTAHPHFAFCAIISSVLPLFLSLYLSLYLSHYLSLALSISLFSLSLSLSLFFSLSCFFPRFLSPFQFYFSNFLSFYLSLYLSYSEFFFLFPWHHRPFYHKNNEWRVSGCRMLHDLLFLFFLINGHITGSPIIVGISPLGWKREIYWNATRSCI